MPNDKDIPHVDINSLPQNDFNPNGVQSPGADIEAKVARESMQAGKAGLAAMVPPTPKLPAFENIEPKLPPPPVVTATEIEAIKHRQRGRPKKTTVLTPTPALTPVAHPGPPVHSLADCAHRLLEHFRSLSEEWKARIDALRVERSLDTLNCVVSLMAYTLDSGNAMIIPLDHPAFQQGFTPAGTNFSCIMCAKPQSRLYQGQPPLCSDAGSRCPTKFYSLSKEDQTELLALAE